MKGISVSEEDIKAKAKCLSKKSGCNQEITSSNGWLYRFKNRYDMRGKKLVGEKITADAEAAENFIEKTLPEKLISFY